MLESFQAFGFENHPEVSSGDVFRAMLRGGERTLLARSINAGENGYSVRRCGRLKEAASHGWWTGSYWCG
jgi:hypothetical protein